MRNQELISRVFEAIRGDAALMSDIEADNQRHQQSKFRRIWDRCWWPFYSIIGLPVAAGAIKAVFRWTGTR